MITSLARGRHASRDFTSLLLRSFCAIASIYLVPNTWSQGEDFAPPAGTQKFPFYPQGGNFYSDLFPVNYVDLDRTPGIRDFQCGDQAYDGHDGIDTNILGFAAQAVGVPIFAVLDGTVTFVRDGQPDMNTSRNSPTPANIVTLDHGAGLTTTYFHLKKDSVAVSVGQVVKAGQQLGLTGSSGNSFQPHLHFQPEVNGEPFEPFTGPCRVGESNWITPPPFRSDLYLRSFVISGQDLTTWQGFPFDTERAGSFVVGTRRVSAWFLFANGESITSISGRYLRPDGSVAFSTPRFAIANSGRSADFFFNPTLNLNVAGTWRLEVLINDQVFTSGAFEVLNSGPITNRPPAGVQTAFDPPAPKANDVLFCRITSSTLFLDPDYALPRFRYLWQVNGTTVRDVVSAGLADAIPRDTAQSGDTITCTVTPTDGTLNGPETALSVTVGAAVGQLLNISTRLRVETGDNVLIGGLILTGTQPKKVIVRGIGPSLTANGQPLTGRLADPTLQLFQGNTLLATNDNWKETQQAEIEATTIPPSNDLESAIVRTLDPGAYTAVLRGKNDSTGIGLIEAYDLEQASASKLANISTRGLVETGDQVLIGGIIAGGGSGGETKVVVRAIGPSLAAAGVTNALQDPTLDLVDGSGNVVAANDNWKDSQRAELEATGIQPNDDRESAMVRSLAPGNYTAVVRGKNSTTGVALVEVYNVQ